MLAIEVCLLSGRWTATEFNDRERAEWPPHPARLFSALLAEHALAAEGEHAELHDAERTDEERALDWLAAQAAPTIYASRESDVARRTVAPHFVPVNDASAVSQPDTQREKLDAATERLATATTDKERVKAAAAVEKARGDLLARTAQVIAPDPKAAVDGVRVLPDLRGRQPRTFPSLTPTLPRFAFVWEAGLPDDMVPALDRLLSRLVRIGHSSCFVHARRVAEEALSALVEAGAVAFRPDAVDGEAMLRVPGPGQRAALVEQYARHEGIAPRVLPARFVVYGETGDRAGDAAVEPGATIFADRFQVLGRVGGPRLPIVASPRLADVLRRALIASAPEPKATFITGHKADGSPADAPRVAVVPLPLVGSAHADGSLLGVALMVPRDASDDDLRALASAVANLKRVPGDDEGDGAIVVPLGSAGELELAPLSWGARSQTLSTVHWARASRVWATATPLALDRNPGDLHDRDAAKRAAAFVEAEATARTAIERVLQPGAAEITHIEVVRSALLPGSAKPRNHGRFPLAESKAARVLVHVRVVFDRPVRGPLLAGAGRYQGMGLFLPVSEREERS